MAEERARAGTRLFGRAPEPLPPAPDEADGVESHIRSGRLFHALEAANAVLAGGVRGDGRDRVAALRGLALALAGRTEEGVAELSAAELVAAGRVGRSTILSCWAEAAVWNGLPRVAIDRAGEAQELGGAPDDLDRAALAAAWAAFELDRRPTLVPLELARRSDPAVRAELRGIDALSRGAHQAAVAAFHDAAGRWIFSSAPRALICRWAAGEARRRAGDPSAPVQLTATLEAAMAIGFEPLAARVRRSLRLAGHRTASPRIPRSGAGVLTSREGQILALVERGRTNGEIARRMGLGRPTVARLLSNAMVKLGAESRAHAIAIHACAEPGTGSAAAGPTGREVPGIHDDARSILARIAAGRTLGAIAGELGLSRRTADRRLAEARAALGAQRTTEAVARAQRLGWLA